MFDKHINTQNQAKSERGTAIAENKGMIVIDAKTSGGSLSFCKRHFQYFLL